MDRLLAATVREFGYGFKPESFRILIRDLNVLANRLPRFQLKLREIEARLHLRRRSAAAIVRKRNFRFGFRAKQQERNHVPIISCLLGCLERAVARVQLRTERDAADCQKENE